MQASVDRVGHVVRIDVIVLLICDVNDLTVGPDSARRPVASLEQRAEGELLVLVAIEVSASIR